MENKLQNLKKVFFLGLFKTQLLLLFDEYDAGRPDVMFVIQRVLEAEGNFTLLDKNKVIKQNKFFRLFATSNTVGLRRYNRPYIMALNRLTKDRWIDGTL